MGFIIILSNIQGFIKRNRARKKMNSKKLKDGMMQIYYLLKKATELLQSPAPVSHPTVTCLACSLLRSHRKGSNCPLLPNRSTSSCCHSHAAACHGHQLHERKISIGFWIFSSPLTHYDQRASCTCISELIPAPNG